jgi:hypothetical protein
MPLLGHAAIAMWWDISPEHKAEFENWHSHEHLPERLAIPGFQRGSRWAAADGGPGFFVLYELDEYETLTSPHYLERLNRPSPWSTRLMPHHRNMVRSQCRVVESFGAGVARHVLTLRLSPSADAGDRLHTYLRDRAATIAASAGTTAAHLLRTETPSAGVTTEQKIRGGDRSADWIFVAGGYDLAALESLQRGALSAETLVGQGAEGAVDSACYLLSHAHARGDSGR